ncbi:phosphate acetyltransferase [Fenollaria massiliensis]|jgi:phosphate acetyltransferase|uniref:Phosphate acetyltransferase n=1 Tax=Fenollaria massiliensis TaxID=938288 RepID=A0A9E7DK77_9FIRM|nr:phosphate acetyltransferase [Fenollaria massiliensis]UQK59488.1 phosphate acetyltransferase [Fenollaria massiliensis]
MDLFEELKVEVKEKHPSIVFPEGEDERVLKAAFRLKEENILEPIVLGKRSEVEGAAKAIGKDLANINFIDPAEAKDIDEMAQTFFERRKGKITLEDAKALLLKDVNYFGTILVYMKKADGLVSGAAHATSDTVRPALQIIKMKEGYKKTSGVFVMVKGAERYIFADCAINIAPDSNDIAETAILSNMTAKSFGVDPKIALLSFSTKGSAKSDETEKVINALEIVKERDASIAVDGELQFDAAFVPTVAEKKAKGSAIAGHANVFIFPSLEAGNIGYKIAQRLGGYDAIGPILQGLNSPVNDLSRGCNSDDVYKLALITAKQAI